MLDLYLGPATGFLILLAATIMNVPGDREALAGHLAMNEAEQELIIEPLARILDKQHFDQKVKTAILSSGDMIGLALGVGAWGMRVYGVLQQLKTGGMNGQFRGDAAQQAPQGGTNGNGHIGAVALAGYSQYQP